MSDLLDELHAPLAPVLRRALAAAGLPRSGLALDLAGGAGRKLPLFADVLGSGWSFVLLDHDRASVRAAFGARPAIADAARRLLASAAGGTGMPLDGVVADAHMLPLRSGRFDAVLCIAALGLFADPAAALQEARRALRPGGALLVTTATQVWAEIIRWPDELVSLLCDTIPEAAWETLHAPPDLCRALAALLSSAGFGAPHVRVVLLEEAGDPRRAALPLLPWSRLRRLVAPHLTAADLGRCDAEAAEAAPEVCSLALVALAQSPSG